MSKGNVTEELLIQYLANEVNPAEKLAVEKWLTVDENRAQFEQLKAIWSLTAVDYPAHIDSESSWQELQSKIQTGTSRRVVKWKPAYLARVAALLIAMLGIAGWLFFSSKQSAEQQVALKQTKAQEPNKDIAVASIVNKSDDSQKIAVNNADRELASTLHKEKPNLNRKTKQKVLLANENHADVILVSKKKEQVCNNTQCPLEICIVQALKCGNDKSSVFAHCSMLQPDESGQLHYHENIDCNTQIQEIRITRTTTGESIVLTPKSSPVTAQDFFDYMTGDKKGTVVAGIFETDCDNICSDQSIRLDNRLGVPVIQ